MRKNRIIILLAGFTILFVVLIVHLKMVSNTQEELENRIGDTATTTEEMPKANAIGEVSIYEYYVSAQYTGAQGNLYLSTTVTLPNKLRSQQHMAELHTTLLDSVNQRGGAQFQTVVLLEIFPLFGDE